MTEEQVRRTSIPESWAWTTIESIARTEKGSIRMGPFGSQLKKAELVEKGIRVLWIENVVNDKFEYKEGKFITEEKYEKLKGFAVAPGDLLITMMGTIGRVAAVPNDIGKAIISSHLLRIRVDNQLCNLEYLKCALLSENSKKQMTKESRGVVMKGLNTKIMKSLIIPLPPLSEQHRIILKIEAPFSFLDAGVKSLRKVQVQLKRYRQAVLKYAFEGKLTEEWRKTHRDQIEPATKLLERIGRQTEINAKGKRKKSSRMDMPVNQELSEGWTYGRLEDWIYIAGRIGWRGLKAEEYTSEGPLFLSVYNLNKGIKVDFSEAQHITEERYEESPEIQLQNNDILLVKDGAGIGKIGIVEGLDTKATVNSSLLVIRGSDVFLPKFLLYFLMGPKMQEVVKMRITGSATPHLFQRDIKRFDVLIPPIAEQQKIVESIESSFSVADEVENTIKQGLRQAEGLRQSILRDAFQGRLVPQDPSDEPADKLLERIREEKAKSEGEKDTNKKKAKPKQLELSTYVK